jgi:hypothetical protein
MGWRQDSLLLLCCAVFITTLVLNFQGKVAPPPELVSVLATSGRQPEGGYGPGNLDTLTLNFSKIIDEPPIGTQVDVDKIIEFIPPLTDVNYTGYALAIRSAPIPPQTCVHTLHPTVPTFV